MQSKNQTLLKLLSDFVLCSFNPIQLALVVPYIFSWMYWHCSSMHNLTSIVIQKLNSSKVHEIIFIILFTWEGEPVFLKKAKSFNNENGFFQDSYIIENLISSFTIMTPTILRKDYNGWLMKALPPSTPCVFLLFHAIYLIIIKVIV